MNPTHPLEAWCIGGGVVHTIDGGAHWTAAVTGLPVGNPRAFAAAYDGLPAGGLYLAAAAGPYRWTGSGWTALADATVPAVQFRGVEALPYRGLMRFATWGAGLWDYSTGSTLAVPGPGAGATLALALAPRRNPVSGATSMDYALPAAGRVTLEVLDVAGRRVATLVDGTRPAGPATAEFDASRLNAGVYFARLRSAAGERSARIVVVR